jgi:hypothetical protein
MFYRGFSFLGFFGYLAKERNKAFRVQNVAALAVFWAPIAIEPAFADL